MSKRILVLGATGTTGRLVSGLLQGHGIDVSAATRRPHRPWQVRFDWNDPASFAPALDGVDAVYVVAPTDRLDQLPIMRPFLELSVERVPGPLVLLSAASLPSGGPMMGAVQAWLQDHAPNWSTLRPSWFMQNLTGQLLRSILDEGCLYSATGDGRVPLIDAADIASVATVALLEPERASGELVLTGPAALTYDEVAAMVSSVSGRPVRHCGLSVDALAGRYRSFGLPDDYAALLAGMDEAIAGGSENRITETVLTVTGRDPIPLAEFLIGSRQLFEPEASGVTHRL